LADQVDLDKLAADAHAQLVELNNGYERLVRKLEDLLKEKERLAQELQHANQELATLAATDALTGLPNKRAFAQAVARTLALADRNKSSVALVMMDIDHFKRINDTWGHPTGDRVLAKVGEVLPKCLRAGDMAARYGGEEFVLLLVDTDSEGARLVAERVRASLARAPIAGPDGPLTITASFGVASARGPGCKGAASDLVARSDAALYNAKRAGRDRVLVAK
jgi:diguanylate cyclase